MTQKTDAPPMSSRRPYLLRAMHEWVTDNHQTPYLVVNASGTGVQIPRQYVQDGKIILNVSFSATQGLTLGNERVEFNARFSGQTHHVVVPLAALLGIYARESGQGLIFSEEEGPTSPPTSPDTPPEPQSSGDAAATKAPPKSRAQLKVVK